MIMMENKMKTLVRKILAEKKEYIHERYKIVAKDVDKTIEEIYDERKIGIITDAKFGVIDRGVLLALDIAYTEILGCGQIIDVENAVNIIGDYGVDNIDGLIGKVIYMYENANYIITGLNRAKLN